MKGINGEIVKRYIARGKWVVIAKVELSNINYFTFRITDKCTQKDYYSDRYATLEECDKNAFKVAKGLSK